MPRELSEESALREEEFRNFAQEALNSIAGYVVQSAFGGVQIDAGLFSLAKLAWLSTCPR